ncbi:immunity protein Imm33 domain-containing protein [Brevibacillus porteri]
MNIGKRCVYRKLRNEREGVLPLNGLRIHPEHDTTGWYIWAGEF